MARAQLWLEKAAQRIGGPRVLALPLLRALAVLAGFVWVLLAPSESRGWEPAQSVLLAFFVYSAALMVALWRWPARTLGLNRLVAVADLAFALLLIHVTGGTRSVLFLALLLIAGVQAYYYGLGRGVGVAIVAALAYLVVVWPTIDRAGWANTVIRIVVLVGTAIGIGILAQMERSERRAVAKLSGDIQGREQYIRSVIESLGEGLVTLDLEGRVTGWNRAIEQRYGITAANVMGRGFLDRFPSYAQEGLAEPLRKLLAGEIEDFTLEALTHETPNKAQVVQNLKGTLLRQGGRPAGAVLLIQDITERVALERSARQTEKLAALGTLAAGLAHELNNPIGIISSRIEIMLLDAEAERLSAVVMEDLRVLHRHAQRVARIAQGLLSFARQSSGQRGPVDLNHVVEETLLLMEKQVVKGGIAMKHALAPDLPAVLGDGNALQQVLVNLLTNARDALVQGGEIAVATGLAPAGGVRLIVSDTGPGIPPEVLPRIFDPFFTTKTEGTGLGLSISYGIVREHKGTVDVHSKPGAGTTFILTFPSLAVEVNA
ncbi:MAG TPA: ATP-binding protein [Candidatus Methylomirabilis sp.]|nr:ATP-binding protein [Candidatus Methylomirabilis sp.]